MADAAFLIDQKTGRIIDANPTASRIYGYDREELTSMNAVDISNEPEKTSILLRDPVPSVPLRFHRRKDGMVFPVELTASTFMFSGNTMIITTARDITERRRMLEALQDSEEKYKDTFETVSDGLVLIDQEAGTILECNISFNRMHGYPEGELIGLPNTIISAEPEVEGLIPAPGLRNVPTEFHRRKDGSLFPVEIMTSVMNLHGRKVVIGAVRDTTEKRRIEEALRQANRRLNLLFSITRHDINNQITLLDGYLNLLEDTNSNASMDKYIREVKTAAGRISTMIHFTKECEMIGAQASAWQNCHSLIEKFSKELKLDNIWVNNDLPRDIEVFADPLIGKVFYNLMDNAIRHGGKTTYIRFGAQERGDAMTLTCEDDGIGIPDKEKDLIFKMGFGKHTGLGLALSREILNITGLNIREIGIPGKGAMFEIEVPVEMHRRTGR